MPRLNLRPARLLVAGLVLASAACSSPAPAAAQGLAARVQSAPDGVVRFSFPTREGVCGVGDDGIGYRNPRRADQGLSFFGTINRRGNGPRDFERECVPGPLHVQLAVRGGEVTEVRARVGSAPGGAAGTITDAGAVPPAEAAAYLLALAREGGEEAEEALRYAVLAADVDIAPDLLRIARTATFTRDLRQQAVFWTAILGDRAAVRELHSIAEDPAMDEELRGHTIFSIGQTQEPDDAAFLRGLFPRLRSDELKEKAIFSLSQMKGVESDRWLLERAADRGESMRVREQAIFWLAETGISITLLDDLYARLEERQLREQVIFAYSRRDGPESSQRLLRLARSEADEELRGKAIFWLGQLAGNEITRELAGLVQDGSQNRGIQEQAVFALSQRSRDEGVPALIQIARTHRDTEIRKKALFWLGQSKDPRALDLFAEILGQR